MSAVNSFEEKDIRAEVRRQKFKFCWLENSRGIRVVPCNAPQMKLEDSLQRIFTYLSSPMTPDDRYYIKCLHSTRTNTEPASFAYNKGNVVNMSENGTQQQPQYNQPQQHPPATSFMPPERLLVLIQEKERLQAECEFLRLQVNDLQARLDMKEEIIEELRGSNQSLSEGIQQNANAFNWNQFMSEGLPGVLELLKPVQPAAVQPANDPVIQALKQNQENQAKALQQIVKVLQEMQADMYEDEPAEQGDPDDPDAMSEEELLQQLDPEVRAAYLQRKEELMNS